MPNVAEQGKVVVRKTRKPDQVTGFFAQLPACLIGIKARGSAHYWAQNLARFGHTVRLMASQFVAPNHKSGNNDGNSELSDLTQAIQGCALRARNAHPNSLQANLCEAGQGRAAQ